MKRKFFIGMALLLAVVLLVGCGGGIPQEDYDAVVADRDDAQAQVTSLQSQLSEAQSDLSTAESDLADAESELAAAQSDLEAAEADAAAAQSQLSAARSEASKAKSDLAAAQSELAAAEARIAELEAAAAPEEEEEEEVVEEEEEEVVEEEEEVELTFTPAEYVNEEYGFSVKYPTAWSTESEEEYEAPTVFWRAGPPYSIPALTVWIMDAEEGASLADTLAAQHEADGDTDWEVKSESASTTFDGTEATYLVGYYFSATGYDIDCAHLGVKKDDKFIVAWVYTVAIYAPFSEEQMSEVVHTLKFD